MIDSYFSMSNVSHALLYCLVKSVICFLINSLESLRVQEVAITNNKRKMIFILICISRMRPLLISYKGHIFHIKWRGIIVLKKHLMSAFSVCLHRCPASCKLILRYFNIIVNACTNYQWYFNS